MICAEELAGRGVSGEWPTGNKPGTRGWFLAAPVPGPWSWRLRDAWAVLRGRAEAVRFRL